MKSRMTARLLATLPALVIAAFSAGGVNATNPTQADAARGAQLFRTKGAEWSCTSCHTTDPRQAGRHAVTGKGIKPMAPAINPQRLTDPQKVEKWFRRNCKDVFGRECTAGEKADVVAYLRSLSP